MNIFTMRLDLLDLNLWDLCRPNAASVAKMASALVKQGQISPIVVSDKTLVDGFKRYEAAKRLGMQELTAREVQVDSIQAKAMTNLLNRGEHTDLIQEAVLVWNLTEVEGLNQVEVASLLERHKSWVSRRVGLLNSLASEIIEDLQVGLLPPGSGVHLARLHTCNQADFSPVIQNHKLTVREIEALVDLWCKAQDPEIKKSLLHQPRQALNVYQEQKKNHRLLNTFWNIITVLQEEIDKKDIQADLCNSLNQLKSNFAYLQEKLFQNPKDQEEN